MAKQKRFCMDLIREVLSLKWADPTRSNTLVAQSLGISRDTVSRYLTRASKGHLTTLEQLNDLNNPELKRVIFPEKCGMKNSVRPDFSSIYQRMSWKHVTLKLLWEEEFEKNPDILKYSQFCALYRAWKKDNKLSMKQVPKSGKRRSFIDDDGSTTPVTTDTRKGKTHSAKIFFMR